MKTETQENELRALAANDIRVLVTQLNTAIQKAAETGLSIQIAVSSCVDVKGL